MTEHTGELLDVMEDPALDAVREVILDALRALYVRLAPAGWDPEDGVDESDFDYEAIVSAALTGRPGTS